jgi:uncharacterized protein
MPVFLPEPAVRDGHAASPRSVGDDQAVGSPSERAFIEAALQNPFVGEILHRAEYLLPDDWYLAAGCLFQTVWNVLDGNHPQRGITDYDLIYFDDSDLSWKAEDLVIQRCASAFVDLDIEVEVRNQARVHLWYEDHFGIPCPPIRSSADAIDRYAAHACRVGLRLDDGRYDVYAPSGFNDLFGFILRPNPVVAPRSVYEAKAARWQRLWPRLQVMPWPGPAGTPTAHPTS